MDALSAISTRTTPQTERADARQVPNSAGGYGFRVGDDARIHRFLTLGTEGGTYYTSEHELTKDTASVVLRSARERGSWLVERIVEISTAGRAPRQNPAIFALAATAGLGDDDGRKAALAALPAVCRTGTHLFLFAGYVEQFRGWGRGLRRAVGNWYLWRDVDDVAYQVVKYRQREGWTHRDLLRLAHPKASADDRRALFDWITHDVEIGGAPLIRAFVRAQAATEVSVWVELIQNNRLSWEMLPDAALSEPAVWHALIEKGMPQTALMRQLPRLTRLGVLTGSTRTRVAEQLASPALLRKGRVHPVNVLIAQRTYASGESARGDSTWSPERRIVDALDAAFYAAFRTIEPAGKRTLIALDVSGSMGARISGLPLTCREASAALALVMLATEPDADVAGFTSSTTSVRSINRGLGYMVASGISPLPLSPRQRLDDAVRSIANLPFGGTDCALPMLWADGNSRKYDTFVILTDNETWAGSMHPHQALRQYRERSGINARLVVVGMTATDFSIADPQDPGSLDVAGFDSAVPNLIADFSRGVI